MKLSPPLRVLVRGVIGLAIFFAILGITNFLKIWISHPFYHFFVNTFNGAIWIVIILSILFLVADFFRVLPFPYDLPYPIVNAFAYVYLVSLLFELIPLVEQISGTELPWGMATIKAVISISVFIIAAIAGYYKVFSHRYREKQQIKSEEKKKPANKPKK
ncbi:MAG: hypothetical protein ABH864_05775 [archaeon]